MDESNSNAIPFQEPRFYDTGLDIPEDIRIQIVELLNQTLASTVDLNSQILQAIWHMRGMNFYQFYQLFSKISEQLQTQINLLTERIGALASTPLLTVRLAAQSSQLSEFPFKATTVEELLQALAKQTSSHGKFVRFGIVQVTDRGDLVTAQLYIDFSRVVDRHLRLLEAHCRFYR